MTIKNITQELINRALHVLEVETSFKKEWIDFEIQDDGQFLLISISIDEVSETEPSSTFRDAGHLVNKLMPTRQDDYSWMIAFTRDEKVVDSYFGGNLNSPNSGL